MITYATLKQMIIEYQGAAFINDSNYDNVDQSISEILTTIQPLETELPPQYIFYYLELFIRNITHLELLVNTYPTDIYWSTKLQAARELVIKAMHGLWEVNLSPLEEKLRILQFLVRKSIFLPLSLPQLSNIIFHPRLSLLAELIPVLETILQFSDRDSFLRLVEHLQSPFIAEVISEIQNDDSDIFLELNQESYFFDFLKVLATLSKNRSQEESEALFKAINSINHGLNNAGLYQGKYLKRIAQLFTSLAQVKFLDTILLKLENLNALNETTFGCLFPQDTFPYFVNVDYRRSRQLWQGLEAISEVDYDVFEDWLVHIVNLTSEDESCIASLLLPLQPHGSERMGNPHTSFPASTSQPPLRFFSGSHSNFPPVPQMATVPPAPILPLPPTTGSHSNFTSVLQMAPISSASILPLPPTTGSHSNFTSVPQMTPISSAPILPPPPLRVPTAFFNRPISIPPLQTGLPGVESEIHLDFKGEWRTLLTNAVPGSTIRINFTNPRISKQYPEATAFVKHMGTLTNKNTHFHLIISHDFYISLSLRRSKNTYVNKESLEWNRTSALQPGQIDKVTILCCADQENVIRKNCTKVIDFNFATTNVEVVPSEPFLQSSGGLFVGKITK